MSTGFSCNLGDTMLRTLLLAALLVGLAGPLRADTLVYGYDDDFLSGWTARSNAGTVPAEFAPALGSNAPAQGPGYVALGVESNKNYTLIHKEPVAWDIVWEDYQTIRFDVRLSNPRGWNSMALVCRSSTNWNYVLCSRQIYAYESNTWITLSAPITAQLTNYLYDSSWAYFEFTFNQALTNTTEIDIDNFRVSADNELLTGGAAVYDFDTPGLSGWTGTKRGVISWETNTTALGPGAMQVLVTNFFMSGSNTFMTKPAEVVNCLPNAPWGLNSNIVVWCNTAAQWSNLFMQLLLQVRTPTATNDYYLSSTPGSIQKDGQWHPYLYPYNPALFTSATYAYITLQLGSADNPTGKTFLIDNIRLLPGIGFPPPETNYLYAGVAVYPFETNTLDGWRGSTRAMVSWTTNDTVLGEGAMQVDVTNAVGNWANTALRLNAIDDAAWTLNTNLVFWLRASSNQWLTTLIPELSFSMSVTSITVRASGTGQMLLDNAWHPYLFTYDPDWLVGEYNLNFSLNVVVAGGDTPTGRTFYVDNVRLLPGNVPEPAVALLACLSLLMLRLRKPLNQGTFR